MSEADMMQWCGVAVGVLMCIGIVLIVAAVILMGINFRKEGHP